MEFLKLLKEGKYVYCSVELFSPFSRGVSAIFADNFEETLKKTFDCKFKDVVFLPFRDTFQTEILGENRSQRIFDLNIEKLDQSCCLIAHIDGLVKDCGIGMEIGYAFGKGFPISILQTDFVWEGYLNNNIDWIIDPILEVMSSYKETDYSISEFTRNDYGELNLRDGNSRIETFSANTINVFKDYTYGRSLEHSNEKGVFIDCMGGRYDWCQNYYKEFSKHFSIEDEKIKFGQRYSSMNDSEKYIESFKLDYNNLLSSKIAFFSLDSLHIDMGGSALLGLAYALNKIIILESTSPIGYIGEGGQKMIINLMLDKTTGLISNNFKESCSLLCQKLKS